MKDKKTISSKVDPSLAERLDQYADERQLQRSAAIRDLLRTGLTTSENPHTITYPLAFLWFGSVAVAAQYATTTSVIGPLGIAALLVGAALLNDDIRDRIKPSNAKYTDGESLSSDQTETDTDHSTPVAES